MRQLTLYIGHYSPEWAWGMGALAVGVILSAVEEAVAKSGSLWAAEVGSGKMPVVTRQ